MQVDQNHWAKRPRFRTNEAESTSKWSWYHKVHLVREEQWETCRGGQTTQKAKIYLGWSSRPGTSESDLRGGKQAWRGVTREWTSWNHQLLNNNNNYLNYSIHKCSHCYSFGRLKPIMRCDDIWQLSNQVSVCWYALIQIQSPDENNYWQQSPHIIYIYIHTHMDTYIYTMFPVIGNIGEVMAEYENHKIEGKWVEAAMKVNSIW